MISFIKADLENPITKKNLEVFLEGSLFFLLGKRLALCKSWFISTLFTLTQHITGIIIESLINNLEMGV